MSQETMESPGMETPQTEESRAQAPDSLLQEEAPGRIKAAETGDGLERLRQEEAEKGPEGEALAEARRAMLGERLRRRAAEHLDSLRAQAEELRKDFPDFELSAALRDPVFLRLTAPEMGVDLRRAYYALHREELEGIAARRAAEETRQQLVRSLSSAEGRPREGGGQQAAAQLAADYRSLSRNQQQALKQRILEAAARGEKIYP